MNQAVLWASVIAALGVIYDAAECYVKRDQLLQQFYNWRVIRSRYYILVNRPVLSLVFDWAFARDTFITLVIIHGVAAAVFPVIFYVHPALAAIPAFIVLIVHGLMNIRLLVGRDGADQMQTIVWAGIWAYCLPLTDTVKIVALSFIVAQLVLSYLVSGYYKIISPVWRSGRAVHLVTRMNTYCPPDLSRLFTIRWISFTACWMTILFELFAPLLLLTGHTGVIIFIVLGVLFHFAIAFSMGLTTFVFAFTAAYPIVYVLADMWSGS